MMVVRDDDRIPLGHGCQARPGPAFVSRALDGHPWSGTRKELRKLVNPGTISHLVVFDTWTLNVDRHPPPGVDWRPNYDNVFLAAKGGSRYELVALDHTRCFTAHGELTPAVSSIDRVQDRRVYGRFPAFEKYLNHEDVASVSQQLRGLDRADVESAVNEVPVEWEVGHSVRMALTDFILQRAAYIADNIEGLLWPHHAQGYLFQ